METQMRGDNTTRNRHARYIKFNITDLDALPEIGENDYYPKGGALRMFAEGEFISEHLQVVPAIKEKVKLKPIGQCVYCRCATSKSKNKRKLSSEHIIPEFLGSGLELPEASCENCQSVTSKFELSIAHDMFDPVRKSFEIEGKNGVIRKTNFALDTGREITNKEFIANIHHPTVLLMPLLYPASSFSRRPANANDIFNLRVHNINAKQSSLKKIGLDEFAFPMLDIVRFSQLIAKIAHSFGCHYFGINNFSSSVSGFIRTDFSAKAPELEPFKNVGCLWKYKNNSSKSLHEIEAGIIEWNSKSIKAVRVQLFASLGMPSYFVTIEN